MRTDLCGALRASDVGRSVAVCGWVASRREHGEHLAFVDVRDHTGTVQCVVDGAHDLRSEYVVRVSGVVRARPQGTANLELGTGEIEVGDCEVEVLNRRQHRTRRIGRRTFVSEVGVQRLELADFSIGAPLAVAIPPLSEVGPGDLLEATTLVESRRQLVGERLVLNELVLACRPDGRFV